MAYVPMPEGSSSDAPVINPGPSILRNRLNGFAWRSAALGTDPLPALGSALGGGRESVVRPMAGSDLGRDAIVLIRPTSCRTAFLSRPLQLGRLRKSRSYT